MLFRSPCAKKAAPDLDGSYFRRFLQDLHDLRDDVELHTVKISLDLALCDSAPMTLLLRRSLMPSNTMVRSASAAVCCDRAALTTRDPQRPWSDSARTGVGSKLAL